MAGYFRKAEEWNYLGSEKAGADLENGMFVYIDGANGVKPLAAAGDAEFRVAEKTTLWGKEALVLICTFAGTGEVYFVENELEDYGDTGDFNNAEYVVKAGKYVKMRRANVNDELIKTVNATLYAALAKGDIVKPAAGGSVAKKA